MGAIELLPQVLDPRGVLAVEQFEQRLGQRLRRPRIGPLISPQPVMPWLVSILTYTIGPTQYVFIAVMRIDDARSATWAPGVSSARRRG